MIFLLTGGHIPLLQHAADEGHFLGANACKRAALRGHLHALKWLRARGYAWNTSVCSSAALGGHLEV